MSRELEKIIKICTHLKKTVLEYKLNKDSYMYIIWPNWDKTIIDKCKINVANINKDMLCQTGQNFADRPIQPTDGYEGT